MLFVRVMSKPGNKKERIEIHVRGFSKTSTKRPQPEPNHDIHQLARGFPLIDAFFHDLVPANRICWDIANWLSKKRTAFIERRRIRIGMGVKTAL